MKRLLLLAALFAATMSGARAYDFSAVAPTGQTLYYNIVSGGVQVISQNTSYPYYSTYPTGALTIPDSVTRQGTTYAVVSIGERAFYDCSGLTSVTIPDGVTIIGNSAFDGCSGLTGALTIPNSVTSIGNWAFLDCSGLTSVSIGNGVASIGDEAFSDCSGLTSVAFNADSCTSAGGFSNRAFNNCTNITNFTFGNNVKVIPARLCCYLSSLTSVTIPDGVTSIGLGAFSYCSGLTSITIPDGVTSIGTGAFKACSGLTSVTIGNGVASIDNDAFKACSGLTSVTIGNGVASIGDEAFYNCNGLDTVYMKPTAAPSLGNFAFDNNAAGRIFILNSCSYNSYYNGYGWTDYRSNLFVPIIDLNVTVSSNAPERGQASIIPLDNNDIRCDSTVVVEATASYGYHFDHWSTGSNANPDTIHLVGDTNVTAFFAPNIYSLTVNADEHGTTGGGSGTYSYGDTIMIQAFPEEHYHFIHWNDGNRDNPRHVVVTGDLSFTAFFAIDTHTVSVSVNDIARGMVEATGIEFAYGTPCTVTATAYTGYTFAGWSNGVTATPYTFAVLSDVVLTALFVAEGEQAYTVTVVSDDPTMGTVSGGGQALDGGTVTIRAAGNPGYHFLRWNDNNTDSVRTVEVHGNVTYTAYFASNSTETIDDVNGSNIKVYAIDGRIVVEGRENRPVWLFDIYGRVVDNRRLPSGVYLVKVGNLPARKVVVIR